MAQRINLPVTSRTKSLVVRAGSFVGNAAASPLAANNSEKNFAVTRTAAGTYAIDLKERFPLFLGGAVSVTVSGAQWLAQITGSTNASGSTVVTVTTAPYSTGATTDVPAGGVVYFTFNARNGGEW